MKRQIILLVLLILFTRVYAQKIGPKYSYIPAASWHSSVFSTPNARMVTKVDTEYYWNNPIVQLDTTGSYLLDQIMPADSGYWFGTNIYNFKGFAELYDINKADTDTSVIKILGVVSAWHGHVSASSANTISFKVWDQDPTAFYQGDTVYIKGYPGNVKYSLNWPVSQLRIGMAGAPDTTPVVTMFPSALNSALDHFFVGYEMNYNFNSLNGDTITLGATPQGNAQKVGVHYLDSASGSLIYIPRNAIEIIPGVWQDCYYNYGFQINLGIVPIVQFRYSYNDLGVRNVTKGNLIFMGNYPNPAVSFTNIKFTLATNADILIQIIDMHGKKVASINTGNLKTGEHIIPISTVGMPAGNYIYIISTNNGASVASVLSVAK
ncbi:MAG: T9SS type A sorting domain-containing protein [Flavipsychrobacter sp.]